MLNTAVNISELAMDNHQRWDDFVRQSPNGTFFHQSSWMLVLERALGHKGYYLYAEINEKIVGILPLIYMKSTLFGKSLASTPFCVVGGVLSNDDQISGCLIKAACELAEKLTVGSLEIRSRVSCNKDWPSKSLYVNFRKEISGDHDANLSAIPRKQRAMVRKAQKQELESVLSNDLERFYKIYSTSVKNLGTPVFSKKLFKEMLDVFKDDCRILIVTKGDHDIAAVMSFYYKDQVLPYYGGSLPEARRVQGNDFMYWELMRRSADEGIRMFDYGRSKVGTGSYSFKKNWGFEPEQLCYEYFLVNDKVMPEINPTNKKYKNFIDLWKKLPLPVANLMGPFISRTLG